MIKIFKDCLKAFIGLFLIGTVAIIGIITLVDPNQFKNTIKQQIAKTTGYTLVMNGPVSWRLAPSLSIEAHDLSLEIPNTLSSNNITIQKIRFEPKFWTLFSGKLLVNTYVQGLTANLNRTVGGHSFLENIKQMPIFQVTQKSRMPRILPYSIMLEDATIHWKDASTNQDLLLKNMTISAQKMSLGAAGFNSPLSVNFELEDKNEDHTGNFSFTAKWTFNSQAQQLDIKDLEFNTNFPALPFGTLLGELEIQTHQPIPVIEGKFHIPNLSLQYALSNFNMPFYPVSAKMVDLKGVFIYQAPTLEVTSFNIALENEASFTGAFKTDLNQAKNLKTMSITGAFAGKNLRIGTLPIPEFETKLQAKDGVFIFDQVKAQLASSRHQAKMQIDFQNDVPQFALSDNMDSFEINELLARLGEKDKIYGNIQAKLNLTTQGNSLEAWLQHLSGKTYVHLTDGRVRGIDLSPLLRHAQSTVVMLKDALAKRNTVNVGAILTAELGEWRLQAMNVDLLVTPFRHLETNITFDNGRAYTSDFKLTHPEYTVNGHGVIDFVQKNVEYQALALLAHAKSHQSQQLSLFLRETPLAIQVKGSFDNLAIQPNLANYADGAINLVLKDKEKEKTTTENATDQTLEKLFGFP